MEERFGHDFGSVRVHAGPAAGQAMHQIGAGAFTLGRDIVIEPSHYAPGSAQGRQVLAHELAHVVQQSAASLPGDAVALAEPGGAYEHDADRAGRDVAAGQHARVQLAAPVVAPQFGLIGCMWYMWRFSDLVDECRNEFQEACNDDLLSDRCQEFMDGAGYPSDSILRCVGRRNPGAMAKLLSSCAAASLGHLLRRASADPPTGPDPQEPAPEAGSSESGVA